ncbi:MAG: TIGR03546 family protein [Candidatus Margulisbacteria bacterium]|nr:TIGR03546 family protein [Candidatus Margulisiibacteriota bacterium]
MIIKLLLGLTKFIVSNDSPKKMGWAIAVALLFSLMPGFNLIHLSLFVLILLVQVHLPSFFLFSILFKLFNNSTLMLVHYLGYFLLKAEVLKDVWVFLYNLPIVPFTKFYNTSVLGGLLVGILLLYPVQFVAVKAILFYRKKYQPKINKYLEKSKIIKVLKTSKIYKLYLQYAEIRKIF